MRDKINELPDIHKRGSPYLHKSDIQSTPKRLLVDTVKIYETYVTKIGINSS